MQDVKEEIRSRLTIEDVVGEYVQLKRAGRNFKGLSPFSGEKTPSFIVSPDKNIWHDFSSNKGGDVFSFIMEVEGLDFRGALELLARKAGVDLSAHDTKGGQELAKRKRRLLEILELSAKYYQQSLVQNERALDYVFRARGLSREIVQTFRLGYAPDSSDALVQFLRRKGFAHDDIAQAGLTNRRGGDLFRSRMMVPLMDASGQVIGFTGRILTADPNAPKYLNTPQTILYDKGRHVFGLSQAKEAIRKGDYAVIVEGNLDVVSSHQAGVCQAVATAGTALTESHLKILSRLSGNIRLAFDGDAAGIAATERAIPIAQHVGVELTIITLPADVKDPDELIQKDITLWQKAIDEATPIVDWLFGQYSAREDMATPRGKRRFTTVALEVVRHLNDPIEQEHYLQRIADDTGSSLDAVKAKFFGVETDEQDERPLKQSMAHQTMSNNAKSYQDTLLAIALVDPAVRELLGELESGMLEGDNRRAVFEYVRNSRESIATLPKELQDFEAYVIILIDQADAEYGQWSETDRLHELARLVRIAIKEHKQTQKETLTAALRDAEDIGDEETALRLRQQINELIKEMQRAKR